MSLAAVAGTESAVTKAVAPLTPEQDAWSYLLEALDAARPALKKRALAEALEGNWFLHFIESKRGRTKKGIVADDYPPEARACFEEGRFVGGSDADVIALWRTPAGSDAVCHLHPEGFWVLGKDAADFAERAAATAHGEEPEDLDDWLEEQLPDADGDGGGVDDDDDAAQAAEPQASGGGVTLRHLQESVVAKLDESRCVETFARCIGGWAAGSDDDAHLRWLIDAIPLDDGFGSRALAAGLVAVERALQGKEEPARAFAALALDSLPEELERIRPAVVLGVVPALLRSGQPQEAERLLQTLPTEEDDDEAACEHALHRLLGGEAADVEALSPLEDESHVYAWVLDRLVRALLHDGRLAHVDALIDGHDLPLWLQPVLRQDRDTRRALAIARRHPGALDSIVPDLLEKLESEAPGLAVEEALAVLGEPSLASTHAYALAVVATHDRPAAEGHLGKNPSPALLAAVGDRRGAEKGLEDVDERAEVARVTPDRELAVQCLRAVVKENGLPGYAEELRELGDVAFLTSTLEEAATKAMKAPAKKRGLAVRELASVAAMLDRSDLVVKLVDSARSLPEGAPTTELLEMSAAHHAWNTVSALVQTIEDRRRTGDVLISSAFIESARWHSMSARSARPRAALRR